MICLEVCLLRLKLNSILIPVCNCETLTAREFVSEFAIKLFSYSPNPEVFALAAFMMKQYTYTKGSLFSVYTLYIRSQLNIHILPSLWVFCVIILTVTLPAVLCFFYPRDCHREYVMLFLFRRVFHLLICLLRNT